MRRLSLSLRALLLLLIASSTATAEDFDTTMLQGLGDTRYHRFDSETLERPFHVFVRVPETNAEEPLPIVYLLDGGITYPLLSAYYHYLRLGEELPEMVLVGISYGSDRFEGGNYRSSDFTAPSDEREWWGGAPRFQQMLATELMPWVEKRYPVDPNRRVILGHSLGGQFVLYNALTRPELFWGHLASNPALHRNLDFFLDWQGEGEMPREATRLFVAEAEYDDPRFRVPADQWISHWSKPDRVRPFLLEVRYPADHTHLSAVAASFRQGIAWLFPPNAPGQ